MLEDFQPGCEGFFTTALRTCVRTWFKRPQQYGQTSPSAGSGIAQGQVHSFLKRERLPTAKTLHTRTQILVLPLISQTTQTNYLISLRFNFFTYKDIQRQILSRTAIKCNARTYSAQSLAHCEQWYSLAHRVPFYQLQSHS